MTQCYISTDHIDHKHPCRCDDCGHVCPIDELDIVSDIEQRLTPGTETPAGECPECGALSYLLEVNDG